MRAPHRALVFLVALAGVVATVLAGTGSEPGPTPAAKAAGVDLRALVDELSSADSRTVVRRLEREAESRPADPKVQTSLGLGYQQLFRETARPVWLSRARRALERAVAHGRGRDPVTLVGLAQLSATQHRFREAEVHARAALRLVPDDPAALGTLGDALLELGRYGEAFAAYDRAAAQGPSVGAYARVARARELLGRAEGALDALELAVEAGSAVPEQEAWALVRYGGVLLDLRRIDEARLALRRSLALRPGFPHAVAGLARADAAAGKPVRAVRTLERLLRRVPSAEYATELGDLYLSLGDDRRAARAYARARDHEVALARHGVRTMLASASLDLDLGRDLESALARARRAYREASNLETEDLLAWALVRNGRCREALTWSRRSLSLGTRDATLYFHRGMIERCLGRASARRWFARALELDPSFSGRWAPVARTLARA